MVTSAYFHSGSSDWTSEERKQYEEEWLNSTALFRSDITDLDGGSAIVLASKIILELEQNTTQNNTTTSLALTTASSGSNQKANIEQAKNSLNQEKIKSTSI